MKKALLGKYIVFGWTQPTYPSVMNGVNVLKHEKGDVYLLETTAGTTGVAKLKRVLKDVNPHVVAVELCMTKLEDLGETKKSNRSIPLRLIPGRLLAKARQERALLEMVTDAIAHSDSCRQRKTAIAKMIELHIAPATLQNLLTDKVSQRREICEEIRAVFESATVWHLDASTFRYLISAESAYKIMLAGRPYEDSVCDIADALSDVEKNIVSVYTKNFRKLFVSNHSTRTIMTNILERNAKLKSAVVDKRDRYLVNSFISALHTTIAESGPRRVVALVRKNRIKGIIEQWNSKLALDAKPAEKPPEPSFAL